VPKGLVNDLIWDTLDPYHYVRATRNVDEYHDLLIVGGEDHVVGRSFDFEERYNRLFEWTKQRFPMVTSIQDRWSGQIIEPVDDVAFIGRNPNDYDNVFVVTGDSGNGLTHGTIAGILIPDLIFKIPNPWESLYNPSRKPVHSIHEVSEFLQHNLQTQFQYKEWVTRSDVQDIEDIKPCSGAVMREGISKVAIYRDENGTFHSFSAVCPHLGGIITWNNNEKSWDCPVHGSRFSCYGEVLNGPSNSNLSHTACPKINPKNSEVPINTTRIIEEELDKRR